MGFMIYHRMKVGMSCINFTTVILLEIIWLRKVFVCTFDIKDSVLPRVNLTVKDAVTDGAEAMTARLVH